MLAQSGKAAANIKGMTIQSALSIGINTSKYIKLQGEKLLQLIKNFDEIEYICIDEISLVNKGLLAYLEKRLREVKQKKKGGQDRDVIFSNVNIVILGDWAQLFPVKSDPLFFKDKKKDSQM
jgi:BRCT domain type II-containing protein